MPIISLLHMEIIEFYLFCILISIYENIKNVIHEWGYTYKINNISSVLAID